MASGNRRSVSVEVVGARELTELHRALRRQADGKRRIKELRKALVKSARPLVPAIRANIRSMPSQGESRKRGRKPLRSRLSRSVTTQVKFRGQGAGVFVFMNPRKMPDKQKGLPGYFEVTRGKSVFRHPVFRTASNPDTWVRQYPPPQGYFTRATENVERRVTEDIQRVIDEAIRDIES